MSFAGENLVDLRSELLAQVVTAAGAQKVTLTGAPQANIGEGVVVVAMVRSMEFETVRRGSLDRVSGVVNIEVQRDVGTPYHDDWEILSEIALALRQLRFSVFNRSSGDGLSRIADGQYIEPTIGELGSQENRHITALEAPYIIQEAATP